MTVWNPTADDPPSKDVQELAAHWSPSSVLDVGCGTGRNLAPFDRPGCALYGFDRDLDAVKVARSRFERHKGDAISIWQADLRTYEAEQTFDLVLCYGVLHFLLRLERLQAYAKLKSWVAPGGLISVVMFNAVTPIPDDLRSLMPEAPSDSQEILTAFEEWSIIRHRSYTYEDSHNAGTTRHTHSIDRLQARKPTEAPT